MAPFYTIGGVEDLFKGKQLVEVRLWSNKLGHFKDTKDVLCLDMLRVSANLHVEAWGRELVLTGHRIPKHKHWAWLTSRFCKNSLASLLEVLTTNIRKTNPINAFTTTRSWVCCIPHSIKGPATGVVIRASLSIATNRRSPRSNLDKWVAQGVYTKQILRTLITPITALRILIFRNNFYSSPRTKSWNVPSLPVSQELGPLNLHCSRRDCGR